MSIVRLDAFEDLVCMPDMSVRDVIARIDRATPNLFQIVLDKEGCIVGTVTDGDIRRGILAGSGIDDPISTCMHTNATVARTDDETGAMRAAQTQRFVPVCDGRNVLRWVLVRSMVPTGIRRALVMAGGFGTRMGERTKSVPKPLLPVGGEPILSHILDQLESVSVETIHISVHYLAGQIEDFIGGRANKANIQIVREDHPMGTAGALSLLPDTIAEPVLVMNGDVLTKVDLDALHEFHERHRHDITIATTLYEVTVPFGVVRQDADGLFDGIDEKPTLKHFVAAGIYYLSQEVLNLIPKSRSVDMPELLDIANRSGLKIGLFPVHEYWADVGRPSDLAAADRTHNGDDAKADADVS